MGNVAGGLCEGAAVLGAVKAWPTSGGGMWDRGAPASLDSPCARSAYQKVGRGEETQLWAEQRNWLKSQRTQPDHISRPAVEIGRCSLYSIKYSPAHSRNHTRHISTATGHEAVLDEFGMACYHFGSRYRRSFLFPWLPLQISP